MKKATIAALLAVACGAASAQNVILSGLIDVYAGSIQYSGDKRVNVVNSGGMTTSWWGMQGSEDLGGGLRALFLVNGFYRVDSGAFGRFGGNENFFSRDASVALAGSFGKVQVGRGLAPNFLPTILFNAFGDSFSFSPLVLHGNVPLFNGTGWQSVNAGDTGWSNEVVYSTPNIGGFSANLHYQLGEVAGTSGNRNVGANFLYFNGPFAAGGFVHSVRTNNPNAGTIGDVKLGAAEQKAWMLSGKFNAQFANIYANYERTTEDKTGTPQSSKTWSVSADAKVGAGKVMAAFANTKWAIGATNKKRDTFSLGYDYDLSKRTDIYTVLMNDKITGYDRGNSFAVGMRHRF